MPAVSPKATVLVTGASGFVGAHIVADLSKAGFVVRGAVRNKDKGEYVKTLGAAEYVVVEDMTVSGAYDAAVKNIQAVVHVSSKPDISNEGNPSAVIEPAVRGVKTLFEAIDKHGDGVKRVVLIGSSAAITTATIGVHDETEFNSGVVELCRREGARAAPPMKYHASKVVSEEAFWDHFMTPRRYDGVCLLCAYVLGAPIDYAATQGEFKSSVAYLIPWITTHKSDAELKEPFYPVVDTRDVTLGVARALTVPEAGGERIALSSAPSVGNDFALAARVLNNADLNPGVDDDGKRKEWESNALRINTAKAERILGIQWHEKEETLKESVLALKKVMGM